MKTYYKFFVSTQEVFEFDTEMISFKLAENKIRTYARANHATYEYCGVVEENF